MSQFELQSHADFLYTTKPRQLAFNAEDRAEFTLWQQTLRQRVRGLLGIAGRTLPTTVEPELQQTEQREGYTEEKYALDVGEGVHAPIHVLVPDAPPPYKPIMVFHGHTPSVKFSLGIYPNDEIAARMLAADVNYAQALAQAGYLVCAVEQRGLGERKSDQVTENGLFIASCRHLAFEYLMQGRTLLGERVWDGMVALTYVQRRPDVVPGVMGCTGCSGGGTTTLWLSALDERVTVSVPVSYFGSFKHSILAVHHCECNYVPHILDYAEMGDLAALIAPRPFRAVAGEQDHNFGIEGAHEQFATVQRAYDLLDVGDHCSLAVHPGGHIYHHALSQAWFREWL